MAATSQMCAFYPILLIVTLADDADVDDLLVAWHLCFWDEGNRVCAWNIMDVLCEAAKFGGYSFYQNIAILFLLDDPLEFKGVTCLVVQHCTHKLTGVGWLCCCGNLKS